MDVKKAFGSLVLIGAMMGCSLASATDIKDFPRVAVMNIGNKAITSRGLRDQDFSSATEYAIYQLSASGWFDLIDYEQLGTIAQMHSINMSDMVDTSTAVQFGKIAGAEYMVVGYVTGLTTKENIAALQAGYGKGSNAQHVVTANVALRIVDIKTGRIMVAGLGKGSSTSTLTEIGFTKYRNRRNVVGENSYNSTLNTVVDEVSKKNGSSYDKKITSDTSNRTMSDTSNSQYYKNTYDTIKEKYNKTDYNRTEGNYNKTITEQDKNSSYINNKNGKEIYKYTDTGDKIIIQTIEGDINEDGQIDELDFQAIERYFMYEDSGYLRNKRNADVDGDGEITINDAWKVRKLVDGLYYQTYKHIIGDVDSGAPYGEVTASDVDRLKNYLAGDRSHYINILEADLNGDGYITITDLSILKDLVGTWCKRTVGNMYASIPLKYKDYNKNHGVIIEKGKQEMRKTDEIVEQYISETKNDRQRYFGEKGSNVSWSKEEISEEKTSDRKTFIDETSSSKRNLNDLTANTSNSSTESGYDVVGTNKANNSTNFSSTNQYVTYEREAMNYNIVIGTVEVSDVQVRNAISKAVRDAIYGDMGILTTLNNGKKLKIKTGF
ncbi:dockerin type I domain-containing protein [Phascolarctobacterium succinatutens]|uniref:dockerin type I domain-containing protein n=1 Tax=Phascolarctobacterium succinatutens TaxID=626940 RepID=UPI0026EE9F03|nr:dockerin type I domain-containing protein [Phascolarctobacterium succinatutens]